MQKLICGDIKFMKTFATFGILHIFMFKNNTTQPLYNTIVWVQAHFRVSYPNRVILRVTCKGYIGKGVLNHHLRSNPDPCYIQNRVKINRVVKRFRCIYFIYSKPILRLEIFIKMISPSTPFLIDLIEIQTNI